jgi:dolichyl-diphosphooligosaccharide--protein glycosyltransferase
MRWRRWIGVGAVFLAAAAVRLTPIADVFGDGDVKLVGDGDAIYHLFRSRWIAAHWPTALWTDAGLDHPVGARIPWPPLFDELIATAAVFTPGGADPRHVAVVAALVSLVLALATVPLLLSLAATLSGGSGIAGALLASLLPAAVSYGFVGLPDHHVAELFLVCALLLVWRRAWGTGRVAAGAGLLAGALVALSFWNWPGSGLYLLLLAGHMLAVHVVQPAGRDGAMRVSAALAIAAGSAAVLLALSVGILAPAGALSDMSLTGVGALAVTLCSGTAIAAGALAAIAGWRRDVPLGRRIAEAAAISLLCAGGLLALPGARDGVAHGLTALGAANGWYRSITEFRPAFFSRVTPLGLELVRMLALFGLVPLCLVPAGLSMRCRWRDPASREPLLLLAVWCLAFFGLALLRLRFMVYASAPLGIAAALGLEWVATRVTASVPGRASLVALGLGAALAPAYLLARRPGPAMPRTVEASAAWLAKLGPVAVLAPWDVGHALRAAGLVVVSSPFGTDVGADSLADEAAFFATASEDDATSVLRRRRIGFVVVKNPLVSLASVQEFRPPSIPLPPVLERRSLLRGTEWLPGPEFSRSMMARLFFGDGRAPRTAEVPSLGWIRLLREELPPEPSGGPDPEQVKVFGVVRGALLSVSGVAEGVRVDASIRLRTNAGREFQWTTFAVARGGTALLRVPYALRNGLVEGGTYRVTDGIRSVSLTVTEETVVRGLSLAVRLE